MKKTQSVVIIVLFILGAFLGGISLVSENASAEISWNIDIVDSTDNVGRLTSMALDSSGYPHIVYRDDSNQYLKYAKWTGSDWNFHTITYIREIQPSLALDSNDYAHISYYDYNTGNLTYVRWTGDTWTTPEIVDSAGVYGDGRHTSIGLDNSGHAHISYYSYGNLKYAKWNGNEWENDVVEYGDVGHYSSIALDKNDTPHISYYNYSSQDLKYAKLTGVEWKREVVDYEGNVGWDTSIAIDNNGYPHIAYLDEGNDDLKYARWTGSEWKRERIDWEYNVGSETSIALDDSGYPHISYRNRTNWDLKYARWTGNEWKKEVVDFNGDVGDDTSIALDESGYVHISYYDGTYGNLKYAKGKFAVAPSAPQNLQANPGDGYVNLIWNAPSDNGGSAITAYNIYRNGTAEVYDSVSPSQFWYNDTNVINGIIYNYNVSALNGVGEGPKSTISATPRTVPSSPQNLQAMSRDIYVNLTWNLPTFDGGSPITNYRIYRGNTSGEENFLIEVENMLTYTDTGLTNGQTYYYKVSAKNAAGEGYQSNEAWATPRKIVSATVTIKPEKLNNANNGKLTIFVQIPGYNITDVDENSITLLNATCTYINVIEDIESNKLIIKYLRSEAYQTNNWYTIEGYTKDNSVKFEGADYQPNPDSGDE